MVRSLRRAPSSKSPAAAFRPRALLIAGALAALGAGCASVVPHNAKEDLLAGPGGVEAARKELQDVALRCHVPRVSSVDPGEDSVKIQCQTAHMGMFYQTVWVPFPAEFYYRNLERYEVYSNHYVFLYGNGGQLLEPKFLFKSHEDAARFVDLLWSFRARAKK